jgi:cystathionine beta-lyase
LGPDELIVFLRDKAKWAVTRGHAFGVEGSGFVRLNIACPRAKLEAAFDKLTTAIVNHE